MKPMLILLLLISFTDLQVTAQQKEQVKEINEQVWKPFIRSFSTGDDNGFKAVHSKEVIRVLQDDKEIFGYDRYFQTQPDSIKAKWGSWKKDIELRFVQRIAGTDKAFEVGFYKTTSTNQQTGETRIGIGKFHVLLRKEKGIWKILMDADTREGVTDELFNKAESLE
jgi:ketosteroid isomerase-like protein